MSYRSARLGVLAVCALLCVACAGGLSGLSMSTSTAEPEAVDAAAWGRRPPRSAQPLVPMTDAGELPTLTLAGSEGAALPLEHTHVRAELHGFVAEVEVRQTYRNPHAEPIEVVYVFPLPENSAVSHMRMVIGERQIVAEIKERNEARQVYQAARAEGFTAALLEQERPNTFTQSVANIEPGKAIDVVVRYVQDLSYDAGEYELVFPMVVGPRFIPGAEKAGPAQGDGTYRDTDEVPDASRVTPPYLAAGQRSGHDIFLEVSVRTGSAVLGYEVPTHEVEQHGDPAAGRLELRLAKHDHIPNRDFVLRYRVAGDRPAATLHTSGGSDGGYFALVVQPPQLPVDDLVGKREMIFVVDVSGSMSGAPMALCKEAMQAAIMRLRPHDTFNILSFSGATGKAFPEPVGVNRDSVAEGLAFIDRMTAGGGTYMADAVQAALGDEVGAGRHRYVFFLTDGQVGNESAIFEGAEALVARLAARGQQARVFGFGVGSSPNRHLLDGLARAGDGLTVYASTREDPVAAVDRFYRYVDRLVVEGMAIDWGGTTAVDVFPARVPDLFASHPIILHGRYAGVARPESITLRGRANGQDVVIPVRAAQADVEDRVSVLAALWARASVDDLERRLWHQRDASLEQEITRLGLDYQLLTRFTSFVAVDRSQRVGDGAPREVVQPVEVPEGVDAVAAGARPAPLPSATTSTPPTDLATMAPAPVLTESPGIGIAADEGEQDVEVQASLPAPPAAERGLRGCGCRVPAGTDGAGAGWLLALLGLLPLWRRRRCPGKRPSVSDPHVGPPDQGRSSTARQASSRPRSLTQRST